MILGSWLTISVSIMSVRERGSNIGGTMVDRNDNLSELVDVYDITGKLVRKQAKRADAVKGLKKGIYIAGGKKYVVTGN